MLLDFDGPVCDVYAGSDPARIAREIATRFEIDIYTNDPLDLIEHALATYGPVDAIHLALAETEVVAVQTATETPGIRQLIENHHGPIAIVSNNAAGAIKSWLGPSGLRSSIDAIVGRDPRHMKPDPTPLLLAAKEIGRQLDHCVFVGDSLADAHAARRAGPPLIALVNRPNKLQSFAVDECNAIITEVGELTRQPDDR